MFIQNILALKLTMTAENTQAAIFTLLELIVMNQILMNTKNLVGYKSTSKNQLN